MRKIGILTFHRPINCGAALQAVATYNMLRYYSDDDVELIDYRHSRIEANRKLIGGRWIKSKSLAGNLKSLVKDCIDFRMEKRRQSRFDNFVASHTKMSNVVTDKSLEQVGKGYDIYLIGSDLVWNWALDKELNPAFFLEFPCSKYARKCSYASSIGTDNIPDHYIERYKLFLRKFDLISVRESSAKTMLQAILPEKKVCCVVDPTLLMSREQWERIEKPCACPEKYVLLYILEETKNVEEIIKATVDEYKLPVVYYSKKKKVTYPEGSMNAYQVGPDEFLFLIHHADFVVTNSFHGVALSLIYDKGFICIPHTTRGARMIDCLERIGMSEHCCRTLEEVDFNSCSKSLSMTSSLKFEEWRQESIDYLKEILEG